jgi:hypothetical protein
VRNNKTKSHPNGDVLIFRNCHFLERARRQAQAASNFPFMKSNAPLQLQFIFTVALFTRAMFFMLVNCIALSSFKVTRFQIFPHISEKHKTPNDEPEVEKRAQQNSVIQGPQRHSWSISKKKP